MTKQTTLFDAFPAPAPGQLLASERAAQARARRSDPESSKEAAQRANASGSVKANVQRVIDLVWVKPGCTSRELAEIQNAGLDRYEIARRLPDAEELGAVRKGAKRKCRVARTSAVTWWPK
jgi:hypothetical protein